jgi:hypothetical protein
VKETGNRIVVDSVAREHLDATGLRPRVKGHGKRHFKDFGYPRGLFVFILHSNDEMLQASAGACSLREYGGTDILLIYSIS